MGSHTAVLLMVSILELGMSSGCSNIREVPVGLNCPISSGSGYNGPADFNAIFAGTPTQPAVYSDDVSGQLLGASATILSGALGAIPYVGGVLSLTFDTMTSLYNGGGTDYQAAYDKLYADLAQEVENLKLYVDASVTELTVRKVNEELHGLMNTYQKCSLYQDAGDMASCMSIVRGIVYDKWGTFMNPVPHGTSLYPHYFSRSALRKQAAELEHTFPMWRIYGDMYVSSALEQIATERHTGNEPQAIIFAYDLAIDLYELLYRYVDVIGIIEAYSVSVEVNPLKTCRYSQYDEGTVSGTFGPGGSDFTCEAAYRVGCSIQNSHGLARGFGWTTFSKRYNSFRNARLDAVDDYYSTQFGTSISDWFDILKEILLQLSELPPPTFSKESLKLFSHYSRNDNVTKAIRDGKTDLAIKWLTDWWNNFWGILKPTPEPTPGTFGGGTTSSCDEEVVRMTYCNSVFTYCSLDTLD